VTGSSHPRSRTSTIRLNPVIALAPSLRKSDFESYFMQVLLVQAVFDHSRELKRITDDGTKHSGVPEIVVKLAKYPFIDAYRLTTILLFLPCAHVGCPFCWSATQITCVYTTHTVCQTSYLWSLSGISRAPQCIHGQCEAGQDRT
jgi:hypothetical protein